MNIAKNILFTLECVLGRFNWVATCNKCTFIKYRVDWSHYRFGSFLFCLLKFMQCHRKLVTRDEYLRENYVNNIWNSTAIYWMPYSISHVWCKKKTINTTSSIKHQLDRNKQQQEINSDNNNFSRNSLHNVIKSTHMDYNSYFNSAQNKIKRHC